MPIISLSRLLLLIKTWWLEHKFSFLLGIAGLFGLQMLAGWYWLSINDASNQKFLWFFLSITLMFIQTQRISNSFKGLHNPLTSTQWLLIPATVGEKFFAVIFWQTILFMLIGVGMTYLSEHIFVQIAETRFLKNPAKYDFFSTAPGQYLFSNAYFNIDNKFMTVTWGFWLATQFLFYYGAIRFKRGSSFIIVLIIIGFTYLFDYYAKALKILFFGTNPVWDGAWHLEIPGKKNEMLHYTPGAALISALNLGFFAICIFLLYKACISLISEKAVKS